NFPKLPSPDAGPTRNPLPVARRYSARRPFPSPPGAAADPTAAARLVAAVAAALAAAGATAGHRGPCADPAPGTDATGRPDSAGITAPGPAPARRPRRATTRRSACTPGSSSGSPQHHRPARWCAAAGRTDAAGGASVAAAVGVAGAAAVAALHRGPPNIAPHPSVHAAVVAVVGDGRPSRLLPADHPVAHEDHVPAVLAQVP